MRAAHLSPSALVSKARPLARSKVSAYAPHDLSSAIICFFPKGQLLQPSAIHAPLTCHRGPIAAF